MAVPRDGDADHPDLSGVAGEMRAVWRAEQEDATADAAAHWRHSRGVADWLRDHMHTGDRVAVTVPGQRFVGTVEEVGDDLVALRGPFGRVEVHMCDSVPFSAAVVEHATSGGRRASMNRGFRDVLLERDAIGRVDIGTSERPEGIAGTLLVGRDHVVVVDGSGAETLIPLAHVAWVRPTAELT